MVLNARSTAGRHDEAERFQAQLDAKTSLRDLSAFFTGAVAPYGVTTYAIGQLPVAGQMAIIYLSTWPRAWMEHYAASGFIALDPVPAEARITADPFTFADMIRRRGDDRNPVVEDAKRFGYHEGFVVPIHGPGEFRGLVAMAGARLRMSPADRAVVAGKARACFQAARRLFERREPPAGLSPREREALVFVAKGMDDAAIGAAMGVTRASAHIYVERAKRRLGAATRAQAVGIAVSDGLL